MSGLQSLVLVALMSLFSLVIEASDDVDFGGDPSCPCLLSADEGLPPVDPSDNTTELVSLLGPSTSLATYGVGCLQHDGVTPACTTQDDCVSGPNYLPVPLDCDRSWCQRSFCWIDPLNCELLNRRSLYFSQSGRYFSYATCYDMDSFTDQSLFVSLRERTLKVGFNSNSGGWTGAYSSTKEHFKGGIEKWSGPAVSFIREAALVGGFRIQLTEPPEFLRNRSIEFFGNSVFSYCVYATALGYLDMCVAQYSVTDQRASATDWFLLGNEPLYLIVQADSGGESTWDSFVGYVSTIFQPFTVGAWLFIVLFVIPVMGMLFAFHEYGRAGSTFPRREQVLVSEDHETYEVREQPIPIYKHLIHSIYTATLSVLEQSYGGSVVTPAAMFHLLGMAFFTLTIIAVYTANLAAILTQQASLTSVKDFEDALSRGYRFCGERTNIAELGTIYGVENSAFVVDPPEEGGDGQPGFTCSNCRSRIRVFDFLDKEKADAGDTRYCHAALAPLQDLQVLQNGGTHCNKTNVGGPVRFIQSGFPVNERISRETIAMLLKLKNEGIYDKELVRAEPVSRCNNEAEQGGEGSALSVVQLMGIWVVTFGFAVGGVFITIAKPLWKKIRRRRDKSAPIVMKVNRHDQYMTQQRKLGRADSFLEENTELVGDRLIFTGIVDEVDVHDVVVSSRPGSLRGSSSDGSIDEMLGSELRDSLRRRVSAQTSVTDTNQTDTSDPEVGASEGAPRILENGAAMP